MNREKVTPSNPVRTYATLPAWYSFDGIYDEIKIYNEALSLKVNKSNSEKKNLLPPKSRKE